MVQLLFFVSSFCSKCNYVKHLLDDIFASGDYNIQIKTINIAKLSPELLLVKPSEVPTLTLVSGPKVLYSLSGILSSKQMQEMLGLIITLQAER